MCESQATQSSRVKYPAAYETANWRDTGCMYAPSCLNCPYPFCCYDLPNPHDFKCVLRSLAICGLFDQGFTRKEIADKQKVHINTVKKAITRGYQLREMLNLGVDMDRS